jgi:hypothetical protein
MGIQKSGEADQDAWMDLIASNVGMVLLLEFPVSLLDLLSVRCGVNRHFQHLVVVIPGPYPC